MLSSDTGRETVSTHSICFDISRIIGQIVFCVLFELFLKNHVHVWVIEDNISDFIDATRMNVEGSIQEDGIARFDFLRVNKRIVFI